MLHLITPLWNLAHAVLHKNVCIFRPLSTCRIRPSSLGLASGGPRRGRPMSGRQSAPQMPHPPAGSVPSWRAPPRSAEASEFLQLQPMAEASECCYQMRLRRGLVPPSSRWRMCSRMLATEYQADAWKRINGTPASASTRSTKRSRRRRCGRAWERSSSSIANTNRVVSTSHRTKSRCFWAMDAPRPRRQSASVQVTMSASRTLHMTRNRPSSAWHSGEKKANSPRDSKVARVR